MAADNLSILQDAIARNAAIVLSLPSAGLLRHYKSRLLEDTESGFWAESVPTELPLLHELIESQHPAGVSFKSGINKVIFTAPIIEHRAEYEINATTKVQAIRLGHPPEIKSIQRRNNFRVAIPEGTEISVGVWRISDKADLKDRPMAAQKVDCTIRDISIGGVGVNFSATAKDERPKVTELDRLRVEISFGESHLVMEGQMRAPSRSDDQRLVRTGIQFKNLQQDLEGRRTMTELTRIVGALQRDEARRHRMGIKSA